MNSACEFFRQKKLWSKYKDLILDYYLRPYLEKIKNLRKPILVVDCFAGPAKFDDGQVGSPLIISKHLRSLHERGIKVKGLYIEKDPDLYKRLQENTKNFAEHTITYYGSFRDYLGEIEKFAQTHTVFVYLDPIAPSNLLFDDLRLVYDQLHVGGSVETLVNFMSPNFLRGVRGLQQRIVKNGVFQSDHELVLKWDRVAGGTYWHKIAFPELSSPLSNLADYDELANNYKDKLNKWFEWLLVYPVREKYENPPKYHLIFGSRHPDAIDIMNRAMVKARREFVGAWFVEGMLFENQPAREVVKPEDVRAIIARTARELGKTTWKLLRVNATIANPCMYTDSEFNREIKHAIKEGVLGSNCAGTAKEDEAAVWPIA